MAAKSTSEKVAIAIRALKIQGARRIAKAAVEALAAAAKKSKAASADELYSDLLVAADNLAAARETEPMLRNYLDDLLSVVRSRREGGVAALKALLAKKQDDILADMESSVARIAYHGAEALTDGSAVLIHCHSTTLMSILKLAHRRGKKLKVYCTETRPRFQGRMSAEELAAAGLDVTLIVDSAAGGMISARKVDFVLFGADAITSRGELLNKVGTYQIALAAKRHGAKVYSAAELHKYDPDTEGGREEMIEERDVRELADSLPMMGRWKKCGVKLKNPAFDKTPPELIDAFITEEGLVGPEKISEAARGRISG